MYGSLREHFWRARVLSSRKKTIRDAAAGESLYIACTRGGERVLAVAGAVNGALTEFEVSLGAADGGVVCALPSLLYNVFFESVERFILKNAV